MTETEEIIDLAQRYIGFFESQERAGETFIRLTLDAPDGLKELVKEAHGDFLPDDYRYEFIYESVATIAEAEGFKPDRDLEDLYQWIDADVYFGDLVSWFGSNSKRTEYVDEIRNEHGCEPFDSVKDEIRAGQEKEKHEVFFTVLNKLREQAEAQ